MSIKRTITSEVAGKIGQKVKVVGWADTIRDHGKITFVEVRDRWGKVQCVFKDFDAGVSAESVIEVIGIVKERPDGMTNENIETGTVEISVEEFSILSKSDPKLPIPIKPDFGDNETEVSKRLDWRWIDLRNPERLKIFKVWSALERGMRDFFDANDFMQIYAPAFMSAPSESGAEAFEVKYFGKKAYLAQSPQFYKQMAMAAGFERVYMIGPVFRAEPSFTTRHMTEFTGWDFELSYVESHFDVMGLEERLIVSMFDRVNKELDLSLAIPSAPFPKVTMSEAKEKLAKVGVESEKPTDVSPEEERQLCHLIKEETGSDFVFLTDYSIDIRPFYHMRHENNPKLTKSFDLLYKGIEITTGAQREHRLSVLEKQAAEKGMDVKQLEHYLNFFRYGCPPHGGGGIGPGRIVMKILDLPSVKEATFLPRDVKRLTP